MKPQTESGKIKAWVEKTYYFECPHCNETVRLGENIVCDEVAMCVCLNCKEEVEVWGPNE